MQDHITNGKCCQSCHKPCLHQEAVSQPVGLSICLACVNKLSLLGLKIQPKLKLLTMSWSKLPEAASKARVNTFAWLVNLKHTQEGGSQGPQATHNSVVNVSASVCKPAKGKTPNSDQRQSSDCQNSPFSCLPLYMLTPQRIYMHTKSLIS